MLFQRCFINVETTSINIRWLNFHFQPAFNVETTLFYRRWIDVILSTLFQRCFANVETTSINDVDSTFIFNQISGSKQCWWTLTIKIFSTLTLVDVFAGNVLKMIMQHTKTIAKIYLDIQTALMGNFLKIVSLTNLFEALYPRLIRVYCRQFSGLLNNSIRVYSVKLKIDMVYHMNNSFQNTIF